MSAVRHTKPETPKQHELKRIRVQEEAMKKRDTRQLVIARAVERA